MKKLQRRRRCQERERANPPRYVLCWGVQKSWNPQCELWFKMAFSGKPVVSAAMRPIGRGVVHASRSGLQRPKVARDPQDVSDANTAKEWAIPNCGRSWCTGGNGIKFP
eukprot:gene8611-biopygen12151